MGKRIVHTKKTNGTAAGVLISFTSTQEFSYVINKGVIGVKLHLEQGHLI